MGAKNTGANKNLKEIEIVWIDANVNNKENQKYKNALLKDPDILSNGLVKLSPFTIVSEAIEYLKKLKFVTTFIISSGRLYPEFIKIFKNNIKDFSICPAILIFCGNAKNYLDFNKNNTDLLLNHPFYNSGGIKDRYHDVKEFLKDYNSVEEKSSFGLIADFEDNFSFEHILNQNRLILPFYFYDFLTKPLDENIYIFNAMSLTFINHIKEIKVLFDQVFQLKRIPYEILCKYWLKAYSYNNDDFHIFINEEIKSSHFIYPKILYEGLKLIKTPLDIDNNANLYKYSSLEKQKMDNIHIILLNQKQDLPFILIYSKSFTTFYCDKEEASIFSNKKKSNVLFVIEKAKENLYSCYLCTSLGKYNNSAKNQILFLPYTFFEILRTEKKDDNNYIIYLGCIEKYKTLFQNEDINSLVENIPEDSKLTKEIIQFGLLDKEYQDIYNILTLEYKNNSSGIYKIFGDIFVDNNKGKCYMIIDGRRLELSENYSIMEPEQKYKNLTIKLVGLKKTNDISHMFEDVKDLINIKGLSKINTSNITNINSMFKNCSMESLPDISKLNTENVTDMSHIFYKCSSLKQIPNISKWKTNNVTSMNGLFYGCNNLTFLPDISLWDTSKVKDIRFMFYDLKNLESLPDISNWKTFNIVNMSSLFDSCSKIKELPDISKWDVSKVIDFSYMFHMCKSLNSLPPISNWKIAQSNVKYEKMFFGLKDSVEIPLNFK